jgi:hypothetical protein
VERVLDEVLDDVAEQKWTSISDRYPTKDDDTFKEALEELIISYAGHPEPRDILKEYIKSEDCSRKPRNVDPDTHASKIETLCRFANRLTGNEPEYDDETTKKAIFESFPEKWQREYLKSGRRFIADEISEIVAYMNLIKGMADEDDDRKDRKRKVDRIRGGGDSSGRQDNRRKDGNHKFMKPDDQCMVPNHFGHKWSECS